jgi:hypothetical protein
MTYVHYHGCHWMSAHHDDGFPRTPELITRSVLCTPYSRRSPDGFPAATVLIDLPGWNPRGSIEYPYTPYALGRGRDSVPSTATALLSGQYGVLPGLIDSRSSEKSTE